jgi:hypothetical protein
MPCTLSSSTFSGSLVGGEVAVGSCATIARKPGQVLTEAASTRDRSCAAGRLAVTSLPMGALRMLGRTLIEVQEALRYLGVQTL